MYLRHRWGTVRAARHHAGLVSVTTTERPGTGGGRSLRGWQQRALDAMDDWTEGAFLISAAPGAGKTRPALEFARRELTRRAVDGVVIACPTAPLTRQWARAAHALGLELAPDADSPRPPRGFHGVVVTYARIASSPRTWAGGTRERTLVIADEAHHLGEDLAWGVGFSQSFAAASRWLLLSGTPFRWTRRRSQGSSTTVTALPSLISPTHMPTLCATACAGRSSS